MRATLDLEQILATTVREVERLLHTNRVVVYRFQPDWSGLVVAEAIRGPWTPSLNQIIEDTCFRDNHGKLYRDGRVAAIADVREAGLSPCHLQLLERFQVRGNLVVPIVYGDGQGGEDTIQPTGEGNRLWGLLIAHHCEGPRNWTNFEVNFMGQVADQLALAVIQAELYQQAQAEIAQRQRAERALQSSKVQVEQKVEELREALDQLKWHQAQLLQSEKLSSLGQLVGGVAHEINNPVSFIYGNVPYARGYVNDLLEIVRQTDTILQADGAGDKAGAEGQGISDPQQLNALKTAIADLDLPFLEKDIQQLFESMATGAERIRDIVLSLRTFSRLDEASFKPTDLRDNLDSILVLLQSRLGGHTGLPAVTIDKHYDDDIPLVHCHVSEINQALMNVLNNALDALEEKWSQASPILGETLTPTLRLRVQHRPSTAEADEQVVITLTDNGISMTEKVRSRLFDPFFTTKPVGQGTGLGLSIVYQSVVQRHQGQITCHLQKNPQETSFVIKLPVRSPASPYPASPLPKILSTPQPLNGSE
ncbi:MAG: GAF domain-containing protein [Cyanobacteria bacterium P01_H01_bin.130]